MFQNTGRLTSFLALSALLSLSYPGSARAAGLDYDPGEQCRGILEQLVKVGTFKVQGEFRKTGEIAVEIRDGKLYFKTPGMIPERLRDFVKGSPDEVEVTLESKEDHCETHVFGLADADTSYEPIRKDGQTVFFTVSSLNILVMYPADSKSCLSGDEVKSLTKLRADLEAAIDKDWTCLEGRGAAACLSPRAEVEKRFLEAKERGEADACPPIEVK